MSDHPALTEHLDRKAIARWMATRLHIWQMDLLDAEGLARFSDKRGLSVWARHVTLLWQVGLLRADLVASEQRVRRQGLTFVGRGEDDRYLYADTRVLAPNPRGWQATASRVRALPASMELLFHPFRYYVLYHLQRVLATNIVPWQALTTSKRYRQLLDMTLRSTDEWTRTDGAAEAVQYWNNIATLAVMAEPCEYQRIFGVLGWPVHIGETVQRERIAQQQGDVAQVYQQVGRAQLEQVIQDVSCDTQVLDPNREVHTLICLGTGERRMELEGRLGGALCLRTLAEVIRRSAEHALDTELREEDELGFGWTAPDHKKDTYGAPRLLDGDPKAAKEYLRHLGLATDTVLRWYVEGDTEYYALLSVFEDIPSSRVRLVNLHGAVAEKAGAGVAFRENLRADLDEHVFSFVSVDADVGVNVTAVRKAAEDDEICGAFFVSAPDFEFANFTLDELESVLWSIAQEHHVPLEVRAQLHEAIQGATTGKELMQRAKRVLGQYVSNISKGRTWGARLMEYALTHRRREHNGRLESRLIIEALTMALRAPLWDFTYERTELRVDANSGLPVSRALPREQVAASIPSHFPWYADIVNQRQRMKRMGTASQS